MDNEKQKIIDYESYEAQWKKRHKASLPKRQSVSGASTFFWILFWDLVMLGAGVFSAAHTIPSAIMTIERDVPFRDYLGITAFVIVEFVIFGAAAKRHEIKWLKWLLLCSLLVAFIGNTSSSVNAVTENGGTWINQIGGFLLSIIAPITALAAGEVLHLQLADLAKRRAAAEDVYRQQWKEVDAKINAGYTKLEREQKEQFEAGKVVNFTDFTELTKRNRVSPKMEKAMDWLREHPEHMETESRELANLIGVSHTLANGARKAILASQNGHHEEGAES